MILKGVFPALVSPFDEAGAIDVSSFKRLLSRLADEGAHGFVPCGTTGESPTLKDTERNQLIQETVAFGKSRGLKTIPGCGSNNTQKTLDEVLVAAKLGADAALLVTPYYNKPNQRGLFAHYEFVARNSPIPLVLYNVPGRTNVNLLPETVIELFKLDNIIGIKEASGNFSQWLEIASKTDLSRKHLLAGDDDSLAAILSLGGSGIISASANVTTKPFVEICKAFSEGDSGRAFEIQKKLFSFTRSMFIETNPVPAKYALFKMRQLASAKVRLPLVELSPNASEQVDLALRGLGLI